MKKKNSIRTSKNQATKDASLMKDKKIPKAARGAAASSLKNRQKAAVKK